MATIEIEQLVKRFGTFEAVRGVDLRVADGELFVLVGPSGCGKTSVLRMVAGLEDITSGRIRIDGVEVDRWSKRGATPAMMFQDAALYPHMTVAANIGFPLKVAGVHHRDVARRVGAVARRLGIEALLDRRPSKLSGGQRQRVSMGRALIRDPAVLLMDEPMSNLDAKLRTELRATIGHLQRRSGITTLYVTHDQVEAMSLGDRIGVMFDGRIVQIGPPSEVYARPRDVLVATFLGSPTMNLFAATWAADPGGAMLATRRHTWRLGGRWRAPDEPTTVVVGIRPHACRFDGDGLVVDVERSRLVGDRFEIEAVVDAPPVTVDATGGVSVGRGTTTLSIEAGAVDDPELELWRPSHVVVDPDDIHLFDVTTGAALHREVAASRSVTERDRVVIER